MCSHVPFFQPFRLWTPSIRFLQTPPGHPRGEGPLKNLIIRNKPTPLRILQAAPHFFPKLMAHMGGLGIGIAPFIGLCPVGRAVVRTLLTALKPTAPYRAGNPQKTSFQRVCSESAPAALLCYWEPVAIPKTYDVS